MSSAAIIAPARTEPRGQPAARHTQRTALQEHEAARMFHTTPKGKSPRTDATHNWSGDNWSPRSPTTRPTNPQMVKHIQTTPGKGHRVVVKVAGYSSHVLRKPFSGRKSSSRAFSCNHVGYPPPDPFSWNARTPAYGPPASSFLDHLPHLRQTRYLRSCNIIATVPKPPK